MNWRYIIATSSISKNFVIDDEESAQSFANALEWSMNHQTPIKSNATATELTDDEFIEFNKQWGARYGKAK